MISVVIPVFNERESVGLLHSELLAVLKAQEDDFEIIFIDDGSTDGTLVELKKLTPVRILSFSRNFGKSQALQAGFSVARGGYIFTMDGDLQDDPKEIPSFMEKMHETQAELVCGWKQKRLDSFSKRLVSKIANGLTRFFTGTKVHDMNCGYKLFKRDVVQNLNLNGDMHRYIPSLVAADGFKIEEVPVHHRERKFGVSKFGNFRRLFKSFFDFVTLLLIRKFIDRPMHFFGILGSLLVLAGLLVLLYLTYIKIFNGELIGDRPILMLGVLLMVIGVQLFSSGFLGELFVRQNKKQVHFIVREEINQ